MSISEHNVEQVVHLPMTENLQKTVAAVRLATK